MVVTTPPIRSGERVKVQVTNIGKDVIDINHCSPIALIKPVPTHYFVWSPVSNLVEHYKKPTKVGPVGVQIDEQPPKRRRRRKKKDEE